VSLRRKRKKGRKGRKAKVCYSVNFEHFTDFYLVSCERCTNLQVPCEVVGNKACEGCICRKKQCSFVPGMTHTLRADLKRQRIESPVASGSSVGGTDSAGQKMKHQKTTAASRTSSTSPAPQDINKQLKKLRKSESA
jgi:hypothetical protein